MLNIACCQLRLLPIEALVAATANAAAALDEQSRLGAIAVGHQADLTVLDSADVDDWMYSPARQRVRTVFKAGKMIHSAD